MCPPSKDRSKLRASLERDAKRREREALARLRAAIGEARKTRKARVAEVHGACHAERVRLQKEAEEKRAELRASITRMREQARFICKTNLGDTRARTGEAIARAVAELEKERGYQAQLKAWTRPAVCKVGARAKAGERRQESDCEVRQNLEDAGLRAVFDRVKGKIKGTSRRTRTEAFLEWAHDHPSEVAAIQYAAEEKAVAELVRQEAKMRKEMGDAQRFKRRSPVELARYLEGVPF